MAHTMKAGCLQDWKVGELPEAPKRGFRSMMAMVGPGAIMLSLSLGSGEWLMGPAAAVQYGPMLMWITNFLQSRMYSIRHFLRRTDDDRL
jgi:hypothetical protein